MWLWPWLCFPVADATAAWILLAILAATDEEGMGDMVPSGRWLGECKGDSADGAEVERADGLAVLVDPCAICTGWGATAACESFSALVSNESWGAGPGAAEFTTLDGNPTAAAAAAAANAAKGDALVNGDAADTVVGAVPVLTMLLVLGKLAMDVEAWLRGEGP